MRMALIQQAAGPDRRANLDRAVAIMHLADLDLASCDRSTARRFFWRDRRPELYAGWLSGA